MCFHGEDGKNIPAFGYSIMVVMVNNDDNDGGKKCIPLSILLIQEPYSNPDNLSVARLFSSLQYTPQMAPNTDNDVVTCRKTLQLK